VFCGPDKYKSDSPVESYRQYYVAEKIKPNSTWTKRNRPEWILQTHANV
jgi:hypothetical protein